MKYRKLSKIILNFFIFTSTIVNGQIKSNISMKRNIATCVLASIGGAVLGLSTLSFYENSQEHSSNVTTGALIGFAAGVAGLVYQINKPSYELNSYDMNTVNFWIDYRNQFLESRPTLAIHFRF